MDRHSSLTIPCTNISLSSSLTVEILQSVGILTKQDNNISFRHQAFFDYYIGIKLFNAAKASPEQLINEIGDSSKQTLIKREHLKYALNMLLEESQEQFCGCMIKLVLLADNHVQKRFNFIFL